MINISDEIKAKITIEADTSGADEAAAALEKLQGATGAGAEGAGSLGDQLAALEKQASSSAVEVAGLADETKGLDEAASSGEEAVSNFNDTLGEHQQVVEDVASAHKGLQPAVVETGTAFQEAAPKVEQFTKSVATANDNFTGMSDNLQNFRYANEGVASWWSDSMLAATEKTYSVLEPTGPLEGIGETLWNVGERAKTAGTSFSSMAVSTEEASKAAESFLGQDSAQYFSDIGGSAANADKAVSEFLGTTQDTGKAIEGLNQSAGKGFFGGLFGEGGMLSDVGGVFGGIGETFGGLMAGLNQIAMPLMAVQMLGQMAGSIGSWIYNANLANEGGAAGGTYTYTSQVNDMMGNVKRAGDALAVGIGQGLLPSIEGANDAAVKAGDSTDTWKNIGEAVGGVFGGVVNALQIGGGIAAQFIGSVGGFLSSNNALTDTGSNLVTSGGEGMANTIAKMLGQPLPYASTAYTGSMPWNPGAAPYLNADTSNVTAGGSNYLTSPLSPYYGMDAQTAQAAWTQSHYTGTTGPSDPMNAYEHAIATRYGGDSGFPVPAPNADVAADWLYFGSLGQGNPAMTTAISTANGVAYGGTIQNPTTYSPGGLSNFTDPSVWSNIGRSISEGFQGSAVGQDISQMVGGAGQTLNGIGNFFGGAGQGIGNFFGGIGQALFGAGQQQATPYGPAGCFPAGTLVLMADNTEKPIEQLQVGESVLGYNGTRQVPTTVLARIVPPPKRVYDLTFSDGNILTLTDSHPIATLRGWASISPAHTKLENPDLEVVQLFPADAVLTADGECTLIAISPKGTVQVYNITVSEPHTFYASKVLVHNKGESMTSAGIGTESVSLAHTFRADVTWEANNLSKQFTAVANWAEQGLMHAVTAVANWTEQNVQHAITAVANWTEQNVIHPVVAAAEWTEQNVMHAVQAVANWTEQNVQHAVQAVANWTERNLVHPVTAVAQWAEKNLEHTFLGVASWIGQNLFHTFVGVAQWITQTITSVIPAFAEGVSGFSGGAAIVGEAGMEAVEHNGQYMLVDSPTFVNLPAGASVYPMQELSGSSSPRMLAQGTGGDITPIYLGSGGGGAPQTANIAIHLDSQAIISAIGIPLASSIRLGMGSRAS